MNDELYNQTKGKKSIEILVDNMWVPALATDLRILNRDHDLVRVQAIRVRDLKKED